MFPQLLDPDPPIPTAEYLKRVRHRARSLSRRRRATPIGVTVLVAAALFTTVDRGGDRVVVDTIDDPTTVVSKPSPDEVTDGEGALEADAPLLDKVPPKILSTEVLVTEKIVISFSSSPRELAVQLEHAGSPGVASFSGSPENHKAISYARAQENET
ncbi:hypothetical protein BH20ACT2_BH20ACT2_09270 [soil metagenome]